MPLYLFIGYNVKFKLNAPVTDFALIIIIFFDFHFCLSLSLCTAPRSGWTQCMVINGFIFDFLFFSLNRRKKILQFSQTRNALLNVRTKKIDCTLLLVIGLLAKPIICVSFENCQTVISEQSKLLSSHRLREMYGY